MTDSDSLLDLFVTVVRVIASETKLGAKIMNEVVQKDINKEKARERLRILEYAEETENIKKFYTPNEAKENELVAEIQKKDPDFDKELFEKYAEEIFEKFQQAYCNNDLDALRKYVDINVIELFKLQASQKYILNEKETITIDCINYVDFYDYHIEGELEIIGVAIGVNYYDYIKNKADEIIKGSDKIKNRSVFFLTFARKLGGKTINNIKDGAMCCPNCGGKITNSYSECEFCHTILYNGTENWLLTHIEEI